MNKRNILSTALLLIAALLAQSGCALASDFDKATPLGELELVQAASLRREVVLPSGRARLMIAIRNYHCAPVDAAMRVTVIGAQGVILSKEIALSQLTWSYGRDSCDAIGYLNSPIPSDDEASKDDAKLVLEVGRKRATYRFDVTTISATSTDKGPAALWLIYGDRVPTARIFGPANDAKPR